MSPESITKLEEALELTEEKREILRIYLGHLGAVGAGIYNFEGGNRG